MATLPPTGEALPMMSPGAKLPPTIVQTTLAMLMDTTLHAGVLLTRRLQIIETEE
jgi:hypothetical protein